MTTIAAPQVIDMANWDVHPVRDVIVTGLRGSTYVRGQHVSSYLEEGQRSGLLIFRPIEAHEVPRGMRWVPDAYCVTLTLLGVDVAIRMAHSEELCAVFDAITEAKHWRGVDAGRILTELDLRAGGDGRSNRWLSTATRCRHCLGELPRRGFDESSSAHQRD